MFEVLLGELRAANQQRQVRAFDASLGVWWRAVPARSRRDLRDHLVAQDPDELRWQVFQGALARSGLDLESAGESEIEAWIEDLARVALNRLEERHEGALSAACVTDGFHDSYLLDRWCLDLPDGLSVLWVGPGLVLHHPRLGFQASMLPAPPVLLALTRREKGLWRDRFDLVDANPLVRHELRRWLNTEPGTWTNATFDPPGNPDHARFLERVATDWSVLRDEVTGEPQAWQLTLKLPRALTGAFRVLDGDVLTDRLADPSRYDLVVCTRVLEEYPPALRDLLLINLRRLTRRGGLLITSLPHSLSDPDVQVHAGWQSAGQATHGGVTLHRYECVKPD